MADAPDHGPVARQLLPPGAWRLDGASILRRLLDWMAEPFRRVQIRAQELLDELDPRSTLELLTAWERFAGLPNPCSGQAETVAGRRQQVIARLTNRGMVRPVDVVSVAASLGYVATVDEPGLDSFIVETSGVEDQPLNEDAWAYAYRVNAPLTGIEEFVVDDSGAEDSLGLIIGVAPLECEITRQSHAHLRPLFSYA